jgi:orotate phosphoribosyltransferase
MVAIQPVSFLQILRSTLLDKAAVIQKLYAIGAIKLGTFTLKSGAISPVYIDLRQIISYPALLQTVASMIWDKVKHLPVELLCGVPYTALPIATCISLQENKPMVMVRKEAKSYGTKQMVEGRYQSGQSVMVIEDVVTSGSSILTTIGYLKEVGLQVSYVAAFLDREQGGREALQQNNCEFFYVVTLTEVLAELKRSGVVMPAELAVK